MADGEPAPAHGENPVELRIPYMSSRPHTLKESPHLECVFFAEIQESLFEGRSSH
jgi:hypothetical protein